MEPVPCWEIRRKTALIRLSTSLVLKMDLGQLSIGKNHRTEIHQLSLHYLLKPLVISFRQKHQT